VSQDEQRGRRGRLTAAVVAVLLVLAGAVALVVGLTGQESASQPAASAARAASTSAPAPGSATAPAAGTPGVPAPGSGTAATPSAPAVPGALPALAASNPVHLDVPAIKVSSDLLDLGLNPDGTLEVPPLAKDSRAGWFHGSPTPGQTGPAVILGHVDSAEYGPGVFFDLGALTPGDTATVTRADRTTVTFRVDRVVRYPKDQFPTLDVYGNTADSELRLITCGGAFDPHARSYLDNIVVYASMVGSSTT
jgi:Sortase domain